MNRALAGWTAAASPLWAVQPWASEFTPLRETGRIVTEDEIMPDTVVGPEQVPSEYEYGGLPKYPNL